MRLGKSKAAIVASSAHEPVSLVASAARIRNLDGAGWRTYKFGDDTWQTEAWRLYDIIGELHFVANWIGSSCSRVRIYVAQVDDNGRIQKEVTNKKIAGLADTLFGGPPHKAEALRLLGINLTVAGDAFVVGKGSDPDSDEWFVLSRSELKRYARSGIVEMTSYDSVPEQLNPETDIIIRVWTPHPRRGLWADCPTRAAMPMLLEIERLTRYVFAQIDSRLFSAGLLPIPKEVSFPDDDVEIPGAEGLTALLMKVASMSLKDNASAAAVVPIIAEMPLEALGKIELVPFASELSKQALELRSEAVRRFALSMDIDPGIMTGLGDANHWGAWQVAEGQIKIHIEPIMTRICDALTTAYLQPALKKLKEEPDKYVFWYDTAPLTMRPDRLKETLELYDKGVVGRATVLLSGNYKISDGATPEEDLEKFTRELMLRDPALFQMPAVRKVAGYTEDILPADAVVTPQGGPGAGPPPPPPPPTGIAPSIGAALPLGTEAQNAPGGPPPVPSGVPTSAPSITASMTALNLFAVANASVMRALELAGKRLAGTKHQQTEFACPPYELHTKIKVQSEDQAAKLLSGAWEHVGVLAQQLDPDIRNANGLCAALDLYCTTLLIREKPHQPFLLREYLTRTGFLHEST